ncbi:MAG TPA: GDP-L-fucose synthase [Candidatus Gastranaerophilaceae bacterium]|nr:GDP-L-fucose synthase [Candidatus Gastranaerophilaceae bacterium]HPT40987.1 GDP-L-fucose synthase [Candidatus Gastranaerophilaceae bacterium]
MQKNEKIYLAGHSGLVGSAIMRKLKSEGFNNIITKELHELDLCNQKAVEEFFEKEKPDYVFLAAAKVGGIMANSTYPAEFIYQNIMIASNVIHASYKFGVKKLLNLGSSCIYPKLAPQPMKEDCLLTSELESTNEAYAIAKIAAIKLCRYYNEQYGTNFISVMPTNQYGAGDNFNMETAHLLPMLLRRFHLAKLLKNGDFEAIKADLKKYKLGWGLDDKLNLNDKTSITKALEGIGAYSDKVVVWGDGSPYRELMHSDDLGDACFYLMQNKNYNDIGELVNITDGTDIQLKDLINTVKEIVGFEGKIVYDKSKPNGTPRKLMDATKIKSLGWSPKINLKEGIKAAYQWYLSSTN